MGPVKIVQQTPETLVVESRHRVLPIVCYVCAALFVLPGFLFLDYWRALGEIRHFSLLLFPIAAVLWLFAAKLTGGRNELRFDAASRKVLCTHARPSSAGSLPFDKITGVKVQVQESPDPGGSPTYRLVVLTEEGGVPLTHHSSWGRRAHEDAARAIRSWLQSHGVNVPAA